MDQFNEIKHDSVKALQIVKDNLSEITNACRKIQTLLSTCNDPMKITDQQNLNEVFCSSAMLYVATTGLMGALYAREAHGTPIEHLMKYIEEAAGHYSARK